jgi:hypothetical protein
LDKLDPGIYYGLNAALDKSPLLLLFDRRQLVRCGGVSTNFDGRSFERAGLDGVEIFGCISVGNRTDLDISGTSNGVRH